MSHLTDGQFEDILLGAPVPSHVGECPECRARLAEKRALSQRLHQAFASVRASTDLADRVRAHVGGASTVGETTGRPRTILLAAHRRLLSGLAAAAAILLVAIPVGLYMNTGSEAHAAQMELVSLHEENLNSMDALFVHDDPRELAGHLEGETGHCPAMICTGSEVAVCGCCTGRFQGRKVGSYVVETANGHVSIVVMPDTPESLGMKPDRTEPSRTIWRAACEGCNMALIRIDNRSYCAVGQVPQEELERALGNLLE
ncbi:MAG: hypothetical protein JW993_02365 [Sedimentisphaerales bacterium]|nr:hypothetical protein [Sedimentisphaerales bacterium]